MPAAPLPANEAERLAALHRHHLLDTEREQGFDDLTSIAAAVCGTPIALVSLLDAERQWFKSVVGLPVRETPRSQAFCGYAILEDGVFEVQDAKADPRFSDNPLVTGTPDIGFYAGTPLVDTDGFKLGTLCVIDTSPRAGLTPQQSDALEALGRQVIALLELRQVAQHFGRLAEGSSDLVYSWNLQPALALDYVSPALTSLTGLTPAEAYADPTAMRSAVHPDDQHWFEHAEDVPAAPFLIRMVHRDGRTIWVEHSIRLEHDKDGLPVRLYGSGRDVTERRQAELAEQAARERAERLQVAKDAMLSRVSHELRTPLNAVLGFSKLLELELEGEQAEAVQHIRRAGRHLLGIVDEILSIGAAAAGDQRLDLNPAQVSLAPLIDEIVGLLGPQAAERRMHLSVGAMPGLCVHADRQRLTEVLLNLVGNALNYPAPGGRTHITAEHVGDVVLLHVADDGPGLDEAALERLFTPFERLDAEQRGIAGTGLGLVLSRSAAEQMGGSLTVSSTPVGGSVFTVALPASLEPCACAVVPSTPATQPRAQVRPCRVVYVEDNEPNRILVQRVLQRGGHVEVQVAADGPSGLALAQETLPDLVLLDLHLPGLTGEQVLAALRADSRTASVPVVVLSADAMPDTVARLVQQGAAAFLTKPLDIRELLATVDLHAASASR